MAITKVYPSGLNIVLEIQGETDPIRVPQRACRYKNFGETFIVTDFEEKLDFNFERSDLRGDSDQTFATVELAQTYLDIFIGGFKNGGGNGSGVTITQQADTYDDLVDGIITGELAYVNNSQGTPWLPLSLGGTYYPKGWYIWNGTIWESDRNAIAKALEDYRPQGGVGAIQYSGGDGTFNSDENNLYWDEINGRLGVGTDTPLNTLDVHSSSVDVVARFSSEDNNADILLNDNVGFVRLKGKTGEFQLITGSDVHTPIATLDGKVGVGTTTPSEALDINGSTVTKTPFKTVTINTTLTRKSNDYINVTSTITTLTLWGSPEVGDTVNISNSSSSSFNISGNGVNILDVTLFELFDREVINLIFNGTNWALLS